MLFAMNEALSSESASPTATRRPPVSVRRRNNHTSTSLSPHHGEANSYANTAGRPSTTGNIRKLRGHPASKNTVKVIAPPPLLDTPPSSGGNVHANSPHSLPHEYRYDVEASEEYDVEASEGSCSLSLDESLQDLFSEEELTPKSKSSKARKSVKESLNSSLSALQTSLPEMLHRQTSIRDMMNRQTSISSLPLTTEDIDVSSRISTKRIRATSTSPTCATSPLTSPKHSPKHCPKVLNWTGTGKNKIQSNQAGASSAFTSYITEEPPKEKEVRLQGLTNRLSTIRNKNGSSHHHNPNPPNRMANSSIKTFQSVLLGIRWILIAAFASGCYYRYHSTFAPTVRPFWSRLAHQASARTRQARMKPYRDVLLKLADGLDHQRLLDPTSDAYKALDWLANDDPLKLSHTYVTSQLFQRWSLATLYFATHSSSTVQWQNESNWMTQASVCDWHGVHCEILSQSDWFEQLHPQQVSTSKDFGKKPRPQVLDVVRLSLSGNLLHGTLPPELRHLDQLEELDVSHNQLEGTLPQGDTLGHYLRLTSLRLDHNRLSGNLPPALGDNLILKQLHLEANQFRGTIPPQWGQQLRNLREWTMNQNLLEGPIPTTMGGLKHLERLEWNDNQLTGTLPFALCTVTTLKTIQLQFNRLEGSIPTEFLMSAQDLQVLDLGHNQLTGHLPDVMATSHAAPNLQRFHVAYNDLAGRLPHTLGHWTHLTSLQLDHNHFTGWIPLKDWQPLSELRTLRLDFNKLGGTIAAQLGRLTSLEEFQFQNNLLHPNLPKKILRKLPQLHFHDIGFYTSDLRDIVIDREEEDELSRMRRQRELKQEELPTNGESQREEDTRQEEGSSLYSIMDLHHGALPPGATMNYHFDEEEM